MKEQIDSTLTINKLTNIMRLISSLIFKHFSFLMRMDIFKEIKKPTKRKIEKATTALFKEIHIHYDKWTNILNEAKKQNKKDHYCDAELTNKNITSFNGYIDATQQKCDLLEEEIKKLMIFINEIAEVIDENCETAKKVPPIPIIKTKRLRFKKEQQELKDESILVSTAIENIYDDICAIENILFEYTGSGKLKEAVVDKEALKISFSDHIDSICYNVKTIETETLQDDEVEKTNKRLVYLAGKIYSNNQFYHAMYEMGDSDEDLEKLWKQLLSAMHNFNEAVKKEEKIYNMEKALDVYKEWTGKKSTIQGDENENCLLG